MKILHIESSLFGANGVSSQLASRLLERFAASNPTIKTRRFAEQPIAHFDGQTLGAIMTPATDRSDEQQAIASAADNLIAEIQEANVLILGVPMYNFSVPSMLKSWFDHIARAGVTFRYTANGPEGLLKGKTAYLLMTRGGLYRGTAADTQTPFLVSLLGFLGITDVHFVYAEGLNMGDEPRAKALAEAHAAIDALPLGQ